MSIFRIDKDRARIHDSHGTQSQSTGIPIGVYHDGAYRIAITLYYDSKESLESPYDMLDHEPWSKTFLYESDTNVVSGSKLKSRHLGIPGLSGQVAHVLNECVAESETVECFATLLPQVFDLEWQWRLFLV